MPSLPSAASAADMNQVEYLGLCDRTAVEWNSLRNYEVFSLSPDGSFPLMKVSRSKAVRLADRDDLKRNQKILDGEWSRQQIIG
ncbi:MAG: hypothetical protein V7K47_29905 [Nostoc sp.]